MPQYAKPIAPKYYKIPKQGSILDFGYRRGQRPDGTWHFHQGLDFPCPVGTPMIAMADGIVTHAHGGDGPAKGFDGYGRIVVVKYAANLFALYAHLDSVGVAVGDHVTRAQPIAKSGRTAFKKGDPAHLCGPHLHFELATTGYPKPRDTRMADWDRLDPSTWLPSNCE